MIEKEKILRFVRAKGPIIPVQISKEINQDILMSSAILSELVSNKELKVSSLKIGSTPLYFLKGQEEKLQNFSHKLSEKERYSYDLLREKKVLRDSSIDPQVRVALRLLKDFSVPLKVTHMNKRKEYCNHC